MVDPGRDAYRGFEYQIQVSAWIALRFLGELQAPEVVVEPLGGEDLQALNAPSADTSEQAVGLGSVDYLVQVKAKGTGSWGREDLNLMLVGKKRSTNAVRQKTSRVWPLDELRAHPAKRFLFITDGTVEQSLSSLVVTEPAFASRPVSPNGLPKVLADDANDIRARVGVLQKTSQEIVQTRSMSILARTFFVPYSRRDKCFQLIVERIRAGLLDAKQSRIQAAELEAIARSCGGLPALLSNFVEHAEFSKISKQLADSYAVVLLGSPGVGKSTLAERLIFEHRMRAEPFEIVEPTAARDLRRVHVGQGPLLVYVEDPFGRYAPGADAREWVVELDSFCRRTAADLRLFVTSRASFAASLLSDVNAERLTSHATFLRNSGYERSALLDAHIAAEPGLEPDAKAWIEDHRVAILKALERPMSYSVLVARVVGTRATDRNAASMRGIIKVAASADLGRELEETFSPMSERIIGGLVAVWLAMEAWPHRADLVEAKLSLFAEELFEVGMEVRGAAAKLEAHRWLRRGSRGTQMHPAYVGACLKVASGRPALAGDVVGRVLQALSSRGLMSDVIAVWRAAQRGSIQVSGAVSRLVLAAARSRLVAAASDIDGSSEFSELLQLVGSGPDAIDPTSMLVSCLVVGDSGKSSGTLWRFDWRRPDWDDATFTKVAADAEAVSVARAFVREGFPTVPRYMFLHAEAFVDFLYRIADMSSEFDLLLESIEDGSPDPELVAVGAARSRNADHEAMIRRAKNILSRAGEWAEGIAPYDEDSGKSDWLADEWASRVEPAHALLDAVIGEWRRCGQIALVATRKEVEIFERFIEVFPRRDASLLPSFLEIFKGCPPSLKGRLASKASQRSDLFDQVLSVLSDVPPWQLAQLVEDLIENDSSGQQADEATARIISAVESTSERVAPFERVAVVHELRERKVTKSLGDRLLQNSASPERAVALALAGEDSIGADFELLQRLQESNFASASSALLAMARRGTLSAARLSAGLTEDAPVAHALASLEACRILPKAVSGAPLRTALKHPSSVVRRGALQQLAEYHDEETTFAIRALLEDETASVRIQVAVALAGRLDRETEEALLTLLQDPTDTSAAARSQFWSGDHERPEPEYGVGLAAAEALAGLPSVSPGLDLAVTAFLESSAPGARYAPIREALKSRLVAGGMMDLSRR